MVAHFYIDVQAATYSGISCSIGEESYGTRMVSEKVDENIASQATPRVECSPAMLLAIGRYETTKVMRQIIEGLHGIKPPTRTRLIQLGEIELSLNARLDELTLRIPCTKSAGEGIYITRELSNLFYPYRII